TIEVQYTPSQNSSARFGRRFFVPLGHRRRKRADVFDEQIDRRAQRAVLEHHDCERPRPTRQIDRERLDAQALAVEAQCQTAQHTDELACGTETMEQRDRVGRYSGSGYLEPL